MTLEFLIPLALTSTIAVTASLGILVQYRRLNVLTKRLNGLQALAEVHSKLAISTSDNLCRLAQTSSQAYTQLQENIEEVGDDLRQELADDFETLCFELDVEIQRKPIH